MHRAVIIKIWWGFFWMEYLTTNVDEAHNFIHWMSHRGHDVDVDDQLREVDREIPTIERA